MRKYFKRDHVLIKCPACDRSDIKFYFLSSGRCSYCSLEYESNVLSYRRASGLIGIPAIWALDRVATSFFGMQWWAAIILVVVIFLGLDFFLSAFFVKIEPRRTG